jgi:hypothetical protein
MGTSTLILVAMVFAQADALHEKLDLYSTTLFHEQLSAACAEYGFVLDYEGDLSIRGWPIGIRSMTPSRKSYFRWQVASSNPDPDLHLPRVLFNIAIRAKTGGAFPQGQHIQR